MGLIDLPAAPVNGPPVDLDDIPGSRKDDVLASLLAEDLDRLSVAELQARIAALETEVARTRRKIEAAVNHRAIADELFRR